LVTARRYRPREGCCHDLIPTRKWRLDGGWANAQEKGLQSALGLWILEKLDGRTPPAGDKDYVAMALNRAKEDYQHQLDLFKRPKDPLPTSLDGWDGEFANSSFGKADLRREKALRSEDDTLILELATGAELELKPWSEDCWKRERPAGFR
jgi:hypothetical protein